MNPFPIVNEVSNVPSVLSLAILDVAAPLYEVKSPPTMILPLDWIARDRTVPLNQLQMLKEVSLVPSVLSLMI